MMLRSKLSWKYFIYISVSACWASQSHLLFLLIFEPECCLDAASLVQEASPHVDITDVPEVPSSQIHTEVEGDVRHQLLGVSWTVAFNVLVVDGDDVVRDDGGDDGDGGDQYSHTGYEGLAGDRQEQVDEEQIENRGDGQLEQRYDNELRQMQVLTW